MRVDWQTWGSRVGAALHRHTQGVDHARWEAAGAVGAAVLVVCTWLYVRSRRPSEEEMERRRRTMLARRGRIVDGVIVDARSLNGEESFSPTPEVLVYSYRLAGVAYECAQDVSALPEKVRGWRLDQPVSVRYDVRNPGNSVVVAEEWSGL